MPSATPTRPRWVCRDVEWSVHNRKRPIAYSTVATSQLIGLLAEDGHTFASARREVRYDSEAQAVLDAYIDRGLGDVTMAAHGVRY